MDKLEEKLIDFDNPGHLKLVLLSKGISIKSNTIFQQSLFATNQFPYGYSSDQVENFPRIPSELVLKNETVVGLYLRENSPFSLAMGKQSQKTWLTYNNKKISTVAFNSLPNFYGKKLSNGLACEKVAIMYGLYTLSLFTRGWCYFFVKGVPCKFCSLAPTRNSLGKFNMPVILPALAEETVRLAFKHDKVRIKYINHCSGSHKDNDIGVKLQLNILRAIKKVLSEKIRQHMLTMPPDNYLLIQELKLSGLDTLNYAIEVFDPNLFRQICPGKTKFFGYEKFLKAFDKAVSIMGKGKMYANFVGGLEPLPSMGKGFEYFAKKGIAPSINVFHPDPQSQLKKNSPPNIKYLLAMVRYQAEIYSKYSFKPIFPRGGTRNSLDTEVYKGYFKS